MSNSLQLKEEGNQHFKNEDYDRALACYTSALNCKEGNEVDKVAILKNRAACYLKTKNYENAINDCTAALSIQPNDTKALFRRCQAYESLDKVEDAYKDARQMHNLDPKNGAIQPVLGRLHSKVQELTKVYASTENKTKQMFDYVFGQTIDIEKRRQAANNLVVLSREKSSSETLYAKGIVEKLLNLFKTEKDPEIVLAGIRILSELCKRSLQRAKEILKDIGAEKLVQFMNSNQESQVSAAKYFLQTVLNTFSGANEKKGIKSDAQLMKDNQVNIDSLMTAVVNLVNSRAFSAIGRDSLLELIMKNVEYTALNWAEKLVEKNGLFRLLEVASELKEYKHESSIEITDDTRTIIAVTLQSVYDSMGSDKARDLFFKKMEEFVKEQLLGPEIESKVRVTVAITALLRGALDAGNHCIGQQGILEMMLVMAGTDDPVQQQVAAEAIIAAASKKDKCTSIASMGINILKKLYLSDNDSIKVRALVGLCKVGSVGGTDAAIRPFADGSHQKLAKACRKFLISPAKDRDIRKWAAEGLSYLTLDADIKEELVQDPAAVQALVELAKSGDMASLYGVVTTLVNVTNSYDTQEVIPEMIALAKFAKQHVPEAHPKDATEFLENRIKTITEAGVTSALVALSRTESKNSRELISRVFNAMCAQSELRGTIVQQGGAKVLIPMALEGTDKGKLTAAQALSRIAISIDPQVAFPGQRCVEVVRPLLQLLHPDCTALQNFEALLGLCNIANVSPSARKRIIKESGISKIENYMYEDHEQLKRAAVQCMVNLVQEEDVVKLHEFKNDRVKYWTLLTMDEDPETSLAAAGGLAILTDLSKKCCKKVFDASSWLDALRYMLANENKDLQLRGTCIVSSMMSSRKSVAEKLIETDIMELLLAVSNFPDPDRVKVVNMAKEALKAAEQWKLIKPASEDADDSDVE